MKQPVEAGYLAIIAFVRVLLLSGNRVKRYNHFSERYNYAKTLRGKTSEIIGIKIVNGLMKLFSVMSVEKNRSKCNERESGRSSRCCGNSSLEVSLTVDHVHTSTSTLDEISSLVDYYFNSLTH